MTNLRRELNMKGKCLTMLALLLSWQTALSMEINLNDIKFTPRLLAMPNDNSTLIRGNPVTFARRLLMDLKLFNLVNELVQAKIIKDTEGNRKTLLFEMSNGLQAGIVEDAAVNPTGKLSKHFLINRSTLGFY